MKRLSADDSADYPRESRTSSGTHKKIEAPPDLGGAFVFVRPPDDPLLSERQHAAIPMCSVPRSGFFTGFDHLDDGSRSLLRRRLTFRRSTVKR